MKKTNNIISDWLEKYGDPEMEKQVEKEIEQLNEMVKTTIEERRQTLEEKILHWRVMLKERIIELKASPDYEDGYELEALEKRLKDYDSFFDIKVDRGNTT